MKRNFGVPLVAVLALIGVSHAASAQDPLPKDPQLTCTVTNAEFAKWFHNGMIQKDGLVDPADSLNFTASLCNFYKWSWQMFLWANSPQHSYGGKSLVFNSPVFYDVTPVGSDGKRHFMANTGGIQKMNFFRGQVNHKGKLIRIGSGGDIFETEEGQAGSGDVLMAQTGSLVYYGIHVNDVYAYFLTGNKTGGIMPAQTTFPDSAAELKLVTDYAKKHGKTLADSKALVIELKTSWVRLDKLPNPDTYIQLLAEIPTYTKTNTKWTPTGKSEKVKLALVGMHVVGTVNGHQEMVWATFEHFHNAPNGKYTYTNNKGKTVTMNQNTAGSWLFCKSKSAGPFNIPHMKLMGNDIVAYPMQTISPSDTLRNQAWGEGTTANNTAIISLNDSVLGLMPAGDVRKNYGLIGALWTNGKLPNTPGSTQLGSLQLANATLETYVQSTSPPPGPTTNGVNCFMCHQGNGLGTPGGGGLSHIYGDLVPLKVK